MRLLPLLFPCCLAAALFTFTTQSAVHAAEKGVPAVLNFEVESLAGKKVSLKEYQGKVVLIVNTASECGATPQYKPLQELYTKYKDQGLVILGFPCNQFGAQEPGTAAEIQTFCTKEYGVTFPMFAKVDVNGPNATPLYQYLTSKTTDPHFAGKINWNFEKFLISRDGEIVGRYGTPINPADTQVVEAIEVELAKK